MADARIFNDLKQDHERQRKMLASIAEPRVTGFQLPTSSGCEFGAELYVH